MDAKISPATDLRYLVDRTTDERFLRSTLERLWQSVPADSPNLTLAAPAVRLFEVRHASSREIDGLLRLLLAGPTPLDARPAADTTQATA